MKVKPLIFCLFVFFKINSIQAQIMSELIDENFKFAAKQYKVLASNTNPDKMPRTFNAENNKLVESETDWWTSGFYPGTLWYIYEQTKDPEILKEATHRLSIMEKEKRYSGNHDIGFMIFCSFGNAYRITGNEEYLRTIDTAAMTLTLRYKPYVQAIRSWDWGKKFSCPVIIDNMMNLELLCWVSNKFGNPLYRDIAINHANTTMKNHFRPDYSCYHVVDYDINTGKVRQRVTHQGLNDESSWSRGQGWALYGYTMMYRLTKELSYLEQAKHVANFILTHPNLPSDGIPYWDFNDPAIPNSLRDVSAASLIASALLELGIFVPELKKEYQSKAELMLKSLSSKKYRAEYNTNGGFLLKHSVGSLPHKSEVDVPLTYADYYYLEALKRYKDWYLK